MKAKSSLFYCISVFVKFTILQIDMGVWTETPSYFQTGFIIIIWPCSNCKVHLKPPVMLLYSSESVTWKLHQIWQMTSEFDLKRKSSKRWHDLWSMATQVQFDIGNKLDMDKYLQPYCHQVILLKSSKLERHEIEVQFNFNSKTLKRPI